MLVNQSLGEMFKFSELLRMHLQVESHGEKPLGLRVPSPLHITGARARVTYRLHAMPRGSW